MGLKNDNNKVKVTKRDTRYISPFDLLLVFVCALFFSFPVVGLAEKKKLAVSFVTTHAIAIGKGFFSGLELEPN